MPTPIVLTDEQFAILQRVEAETARLNDNPHLREDSGAMKGAGDLLEEAQALHLPEVALVSLRNWVNLYGHQRNRTD